MGAVSVANGISSPSKWTRLALAVVVLVPPGIVFHLIWTRGVNVPYTDEWGLVPFVLKASAGPVTFSDLWAQLNEHRIAATRLIILILLPLTRFNVVGHMFAAFALAVAALVLLWRSLHLTAGAVSPRLAAFLMVPVSLFLFSTGHYETWLHSLPALQWQLSAFCAALVVWSLSKSLPTWQIMAIGVASTAASYLSIASGVALWPATVAGVLLVRTDQSGHGRIIGVGAFVLAMLVLAYVIGYERPPQNPSPMSMVWHGWSVVVFLCGLIGAPVAFHFGLGPSTVIGAGLLATSIALVSLSLDRVRLRRGTVAPWLMLWTYALGAASITAVGRAAFPETALARRYTAGTALFWIATLVVGGLVWSARARHLGRHMRVAVAAVATLGLAGVSVGYAGAYRRGWREIDLQQNSLVYCRDEVLFPELAHAQALAFLLPPNPEIVREYSALLLKARLGPFSGERTRNGQ